MSLHLLSQPERPFHQLPLLSQDELRTLLVDWAGPASSYPRGSTIPEVFSRVVATFPDSIALESGDSRFTYSQLDALSNQLAHLLLSRGVRPDSHVALALERTPQLIISLLAILKAGAAYVPLDTAYPPELAEDMARRIPGAEFVMFERTGHLANLEQPERFNQVVFDFISRHNP